MKRTDLEPGVDYLASASNDWDVDSYTEKKRVRVLSTEPLGIDRFARRYPSSRNGPKVVVTYQERGVSVRLATRAGRMDSVAVAPVDERGNVDLTKTYALPTRQIRATWVEGQQVLADRAKAEREEAQVRRREREARQAKGDAMAARLDALGVDYSWAQYDRNSGNMPRVSAKGIEQLMDLAEGQR